MPVDGPGRGARRKGRQPLLAALGKELAPRWAELHRQHGVDMRVGVGVEAFIGNERVEAVRLTDGSQVPADLVIVGLGVTPATDWLDGSGLRVDDGVICDATGAAEARQPMSSLPVMSRAGGIRCMSGTCAPSTGTMPDVRARLRLEPCWRAPSTRRPYGEVPISGPTNMTSSSKCSGLPTDYDALEIVEGDPESGSSSLHTVAAVAPSRCWERYRAGCTPIATPSANAPSSRRAGRISLAA